MTVTVWCTEHCTHWWQSWIQHGRLCWKSTLLATELNVYGNSRLYCRFRQQSTFIVEFNFVASVIRALD